MPATKSTTVTFKSRPLTSGAVSWFIVERYPDGTEKLIPRPEFTRLEDKPKMLALAAVWRKAVARGETEPGPETTDAWMDRFIKSRTGKVTTASRDHQQWSKWVSTVKVRGGALTFGALSMVDVTPDDIEGVRDGLNAEIERWEASGKKRGVGLAYSTAGNVWAIVTQAFKHASTRKGDKDLRTRLDRGNPCADIPPPKSGEGKRRHWLRPSELALVFASNAPEVTDEWKATIAIATYLHLRPNELHVLRVRDVDLEVREASVTRAWDAENECVKEPKTATGVRKVTIPETLVPLLEKLTTNAKPDALLCPLVGTTPEHDRPETFRSILKAAGVRRAELFEDSATHERVDFRSTRDTGITWRFIAGHRAEVIQREAGHRTIEQTLAYAKEVQDHTGRYGVPFPDLPFAPLPKLAPPSPESDPTPTRREPRAEVDKSERASIVHESVHGKCTSEPRPSKTSIKRAFLVARVGFEPTPFGL